MHSLYWNFSICSNNVLLPISPRSVFNLESHIAFGDHTISFNLELPFSLPLFFVTLTLTSSCFMFFSIDFSDVSSYQVLSRGGSTTDVTYSLQCISQSLEALGGNCPNIDDVNFNHLSDVCQNSPLWSSYWSYVINK